MTEINEEEQIPNKFYKRLDSPADISIFYNLRSYSTSLLFVSLDESKKILAQLARNIKLIISEYSGNHEKRCRDINYWMNKKIEASDVNIEKQISSESTAVFNEIEWNKEGKVVRVCKREDPYENKPAEIMKKLDDYCEIRDNNRYNVLKNKTECLKYNRYIKERKEHFSSLTKVTCNIPGCKKYDYTIDDNCSLNNMEDTFPEINCEFTPVGSIIHRFKRRKYYLKRNIERVDDDRYSLYNSDTIPADSENKSYYIEYARPHN
ncbi:unnamed protein product [Plasmodium vivax]|uniref:(malaria parasite P. vivax) hypothetical protein n=1 Tax=Plasmodium vivax TaxID=5855 RepID=A0A8S4HGI8_PLAVI|nr:unnamed protein product [Plasmodium vivax]